MRKIFSNPTGILLLIFQVFLRIRLTHNQFYNIYPAPDIKPNELPLNTTHVHLGAFLELTVLNGKITLERSSMSIICLECQKKIVNSDPNLLPGMKLEILYYDTSYVNTSQASIAALEYSLITDHIASLGPNSADLLLPITKYLQSLKIATYSPTLLSSTFSSRFNFPNLRTITVSDYYVTANYVQLLKFFGWTWIAAAFADDDIGQSGRYSFAQFSNSGLDFPCFYIVGTQNDAGLSALSQCIYNYTDIQVLLLWGSAGAVVNAYEYLYRNTNLSYLTFVMNPTAAVSINYNSLSVPNNFFQGAVFLSENYDEDSGFYDCIDEFLEDPTLMDESAQVAYETYYGCKLTNDSSLPVCSYDPEQRLTGTCRCDIEYNNYLSKPYTQIPVFFRDIIQSYALALTRIKSDCGSLSGDYCNKTSITGQDLLNAVDQNEFVGFSGLISYNTTSGTNRVNGTLNAYQLILGDQVEGSNTSLSGPFVNGSSVVIQEIGFLTPQAIQSADGIYLDQSIFKFKTGGDSVPISIPTPETTDLSSGFWPCFIFSLSIIGLILIAYFFGFIVWKWDTPTVRKAGHVFLILQLVGLAFVFTANLLWCLETSIYMCIIKAILTFLGVTLCCGAMFAKAVEFYIIFTNCRRRSYDTAAPDRLKTFLISFGIVFINSLIWYCLYEFVAGPILCESFQSSSDFYYWYLGCLPADTTSDNVYIILWISLTAAINFFAVILLAIAWDLVSIYGLARCIIFVECNLIILTITILPLYYSLPVYPNYSLQQFLVRSLSSTFATYFTMLFIFAPLVYSFYSDDDDEVMNPRNQASSASYDPLNLSLD